MRVPYLVYGGQIVVVSCQAGGCVGGSERGSLRELSWCTAWQLDSVGLGLCEACMFRSRFYFSTIILLPQVCSGLNLLLMELSWQVKEYIRYT